MKRSGVEDHGLLDKIKAKTPFIEVDRKLQQGRSVCSQPAVVVVSVRVVMHGTPDGTLAFSAHQGVPPKASSSRRSSNVPYFLLVQCVCVCVCV